MWSDDHFVGSNIEVKLISIKDVFYFLDNLHSHMFLPQIITAFYNQGPDFVRGKMSVGRFFPDINHFSFPNFLPGSVWKSVEKSTFNRFRLFRQNHSLSGDEFVHFVAFRFVVWVQKTHVLEKFAQDSNTHFSVTKFSLSDSLVWNHKLVVILKNILMGIRVRYF